MGTYIFDLDGTLVNIDHRLHFIAEGKHKDYDAFAKACVDDTPVHDVINLLIDLAEDGHDVRIWSGRSAVAEQETRDFLHHHIRISAKFGRIYGDDLVEHMRPIGDHRPDTVLKEEWLYAFHQENGRMPDMIFDDRQSVVDMWRKNGVTCAQVATWDDRKTRVEPLNKKEPRFIMMVGPSGAGKSTYIKNRFQPVEVVSSDAIRQELCGDFKSQTRNDDVFRAVDFLVEARLKAGLRVVVDATNLRNKDRRKYVELARGVDPKVVIQYIVIDRPMEEKHRDGGWRSTVTVKDGIPLIEYHDNIFRQNLKSILTGDNLGVMVLDERTNK